MLRLLMAAIHRWMAIFYDYPVTPLEVTLGWLWLVWGVQLIMFPSLLDGGRVHQISRQLVPEWQLGSIYLLIGVALLAGATSRLRPFRRIAAFLSAVGWMNQLILAAAAAGFANLTVGLDLVMGTASLWMVWRWAGLRPGKL